MKETYMSFSQGLERRSYRVPYGAILLHVQYVSLDHLFVRDVRLIMDRNSRRSKGVGYIEFYNAMSVPMAIALSGQLLLGQPVMVKPSEAEKNLVQSTATSAGAGGLSGPYSGRARKLYVGNLHFNMTEDQLRQVQKQSFTTVTYVMIMFLRICILALPHICSNHLSETYDSHTRSRRDGYDTIRTRDTSIIENIGLGHGHGLDTVL